MFSSDHNSRRLQEVPDPGDQTRHQESTCEYWRQRKTPIVTSIKHWKFEKCILCSNRILPVESDHQLLHRDTVIIPFPTIFVHLDLGMPYHMTQSKPAPSVPRTGKEDSHPFPAPSTCSRTLVERFQQNRHNPVEDSSLKLDSGVKWGLPASHCFVYSRSWCHPRYHVGVLLALRPLQGSECAVEWLSQKETPLHIIKHCFLGT